MFRFVTERICYYHCCTHPSSGALPVSQPPITFAVLLASVLTVAFPAYSADTLNSIEVPGERAYPESISAAPDGTLYVGSLASCGIARFKPGASKSEP